MLELMGACCESMECAKGGCNGFIQPNEKLLYDLLRRRANLHLSSGNENQYAFQRKYTLGKGNTKIIKDEICDNDRGRRTEHKQRLETLSHTFQPYNKITASEILKLLKTLLVEAPVRKPLSVGQKVGPSPNSTKSSGEGTFSDSDRTESEYGYETDSDTGVNFILGEEYASLPLNANKRNAENGCAEEYLHNFASKDLETAPRSSPIVQAQAQHATECASFAGEGTKANLQSSARGHGVGIKLKLEDDCEENSYSNKDLSDGETSSYSLAATDMSSLFTRSSCLKGGTSNSNETHDGSLLMDSVVFVGLLLVSSEGALWNRERKAPKVDADSDALANAFPLHALEYALTVLARRVRKYIRSGRDGGESKGNEMSREALVTMKSQTVGHNQESPRVGDIVNISRTTARIQRLDKLCKYASTFKICGLCFCSRAKNVDFKVSLNRKSIMDICWENIAAEQGASTFSSPDTALALWPYDMALFPCANTLAAVSEQSQLGANAKGKAVCFCSINCLLMLMDYSFSMKQYFVHHSFVQDKMRLAAALIFSGATKLPLMVLSQRSTYGNITKSEWIPGVGERFLRLRESDVELKSRHTWKQNSPRAALFLKKQNSNQNDAEKKKQHESSVHSSIVSAGGREGMCGHLAAAVVIGDWKFKFEEPEDNLNADCENANWPPINMTMISAIKEALDQLHLDDKEFVNTLNWSCSPDCATVVENLDCQEYSNNRRLVYAEMNKRQKLKALYQVQTGLTDPMAIFFTFKKVETDSIIALNSPDACFQIALDLAVAVEKGIGAANDSIEVAEFGDIPFPKEAWDLNPFASADLPQAFYRQRQLSLYSVPDFVPAHYQRADIPGINYTPQYVTTKTLSKLLRGKLISSYELLPDTHTVDMQAESEYARIMINIQESPRNDSQPNSRPLKMYSDNYTLQLDGLVLMIAIPSEERVYSSEGLLGDPNYFEDEVLNGEASFHWVALKRIDRFCLNDPYLEEVGVNKSFGTRAFTMGTNGNFNLSAPTCGCDNPKKCVGLNMQLYWFCCSLGPPLHGRFSGHRSSVVMPLTLQNLVELLKSQPKHLPCVLHLVNTYQRFPSS